MTFPQNGILDNFNRADQGPQPSASWTQLPANWGPFIDGGLRVVSNRCANDGLTFDTCGDYWNPTLFSADQEAYATINVIPAGSYGFGLTLRVASNPVSDPTGYHVDWVGSGVFNVWRDGINISGDQSLSMSAGDSFGASIVGNTIHVYYKPSAGSWSEIYSIVDSTYNRSGYIGMILYGSTVRTDDFGGGTSGGSAPPTAFLYQMSLNAVFPQSSFQNVSGTIGGVEIAGSVRSLHRAGHLCSPGQIATLVLNTDFLGTVQPGQSAVIYERGVKVITGYVVKVSRERPSHDWTVEIMDTFTRMTNYFIDTEEITTKGHDTKYWIGNICNRTGISYHISELDQSYPIPPGIQIGMRTANEALRDIITYSSQYMFVDPDGVLQIARQISEKTKIANVILSVSDPVSDEQTRNTIKVYGGGSGTSTLPNNVIFAKANVDVDGLLVDEIAVVGAPMIETQSEAQRVADYMVWQLGAQTRHLTAEIPGTPLLRIGQNVGIAYSRQNHDYSGGGVLTSLETRYDNTGYITTITIGERCPRIAGWSTYIPSVFAGTAGNGVWRSDDRGVNWYEYNQGLPQGSKAVTRVAANVYNQVAAIINGKLYYNGGGTWEQQILPSPTGFPSYGTLKAVDALGGPSGFAALATNGTNSWVYFSPSSGSENSSSGSWTPTQMTYTDLSSGSTTTHIVGHDLNSQTGIAYVLATTSIGGTSGSGLSLGADGTPVTFEFYSCVKSGVSGNIRDQLPDGHSVFSANAFDYTGFQITYPDWSTYFGETRPSYLVNLKVGNLPYAIRGQVGTLTAHINAGSNWEATPPSYGGLYNFKPFIKISSASDPTIPLLHQMATSGGNSGAYIDSLSITANLDSSGLDALPDDSYGFFGMIYQPWSYSNDNGSMPAGSIWWKTWNLDSAISSVTWAGSSGSYNFGPPLTSGSTTLDLYSVSEAGASVVSTIQSSYNYGLRLGVTEDGNLYVYQLTNKLLASYNNGTSFSNVYPTGASGNITGVSRNTSGSSTVIGMGTIAKYQSATPEVAGGWINTGALISGSNISDLLCSQLSTQGMLIGSSTQGIHTKISRFDPALAPFTSVGISDTGLRDEAGSAITDLDTA